MSRRLTGLFVCTDKAKRINRISVLRILLPLSLGFPPRYRRVWALLNYRYKLDEIKNEGVNNARSNDKHGSCRYSCVRGLGPLVGRDGLT